MKTKQYLYISILLVVSYLLLTACVQQQQQQQQSKVITIGFVTPVPIMEPILKGFKAGMTKLGYVEGENIVYIYEGPVGKDGLENTTQNLLKQNVDLILVITTPAIKVVQEATKGTDKPVIFVANDPVKAGIVKSLKEPGGNSTGIATGAAEGRRMEYLAQLAPNIKRVYLPYNPTDQSPAGAIEAIQKVADKSGIELVLQKASTADEVKTAIVNIPDNVDAVFIGPDSLVGSLFKEWIEATIERKLPLTGSSASHVEAGMLMSYSYDAFALGEQAARLADRILKGGRPANMPVETSEFFLSLNLKTAKAIGLNIPEAMLRQAKVIIRE